VRWISYRADHSITDDAFVEAHIVNVAPQSVSGRIVRFLVDENDRVKEGEPLVEIDPVPYRDQVELADSKLATAQAELRPHDAARADVRLAEARLARAVAARGRIEVSKREVEAARSGALKAAKGVDLADLGHDQVHEAELLTAVKREAVEEARRSLAASRNQ